nr:hypothetical protein [Alicyclobacillus acidocaldarius]
MMTLTSIPRVVGSASSAWWNKRSPAVAVMRRASPVAALMAAGVALAVSFPRTDLWIVMPFIIVMAFTEGVYFPAVGTAVPQLLPEESWQQANALIQGTSQVGRMVASFVLAPVVTKVAYWASCPIVAALYLFTSLVLPTSRPRQAAAGSLAGMLLLTFTSRFRVSVHLLLGGLYLGTLFWLLIPLYPHVAWCACLMALSMAAFVWVNIQSISLIQIWFRGSSLASVMSILWTAAIVLGLVSYAVDGALLKWLSIQVLFVASACLIAIVVTAALICILVRPTWIPQQAKASEVA